MADATRAAPTRKIATEQIVSQGSWERKDAIAPTSPPATAPTTSDAKGAYSESTSAIRTSPGSFASAFRTSSNLRNSKVMELAQQVSCQTSNNSKAALNGLC